MAKTTTAAELRGLTRGELDASVGELKEELFRLRFQPRPASWSRTAGCAPCARTSPGSTRC